MQWQKSPIKETTAANLARVDDVEDHASEVSVGKESAKITEPVAELANDDKDWKHERIIAADEVKNSRRWSKMFHVQDQSIASNFCADQEEPKSRS